MNQNNKSTSPKARCLTTRESKSRNPFGKIDTNATFNKTKKTTNVSKDKDQMKQYFVAKPKKF